ncbi:DUF983 domain-containing protein [Nitratireductor sp. CAU 1489]|uniref:DUF983 domain-containing protein n=1 Tax=Nitratireductor arenosus TaxID=2682096 RepID=A0A844QLH6_9HYPH|nr:DUF983 domain-containing protein [Nitratireductor arenosus]MVA98800.1 DUF983 domain-containing protein [Nitratireductor arenosus]
MNQDKAHYPPVEPIGAGLKGRCPRCGKGRLFSGYLNVNESCADCGLSFDFADAGDGPAVFVMLFIGFLVVGLALWVEVSFGPPLWLHFLLWIPLAIVGSLVPLRLFKGVLINLQHANKAAEGRLDHGDE